MKQDSYQHHITENFETNMFGKLTPYIADLDVTDINCNGNDIWINHVEKGRYKLENLTFSPQEINQLAYRISNTENKQFNKVSPILEADLFDLRFHFTHESFSISGPSVSIRKTPIISRIDDQSMKKNGVKYLSERAKELLKACITSKLNIVICGETGSGKTELVKYLMKFTKEYERIITIEDTAELHLKKIYPQKDIVELKINGHVDYDLAIKSCMRMLPVWILLSESRGKEVKELMKCISTGAKIVTTLHTNNAKLIPLRLMNMFDDNELSNDRLESMIYSYIDIGIHINRYDEIGKTIRYVDQIVYFDIDSSGHKIEKEIYKVTRYYDHFEYIYSKLPLMLIELLDPIIFSDKGWQDTHA